MQETQGAQAETILLAGTQAPAHVPSGTTLVVSWQKPALSGSGLQDCTWVSPAALTPDWCAPLHNEPLWAVIFFMALSQRHHVLPAYDSNRAMGFLLEITENYGK